MTAEEGFLRSLQNLFCPRHSQAHPSEAPAGLTGTGSTLGLLVITEHQVAAREWLKKTFLEYSRTYLLPKTEGTLWSSDWEIIVWHRGTNVSSIYQLLRKQNKAKTPQKTTETSVRKTTDIKCRSVFLVTPGQERGFLCSAAAGKGW